MIKKCPNCGSTDIVPDLTVLARGEKSVGSPVFVTLVHPAKKGDDLTVGFRADICGSCGHAEFHTRYGKDVLDAHKKGYVSFK